MKRPNNKEYFGIGHILLSGEHPKVEYETIDDRSELLRKINEYLDRQDLFVISIQRYQETERLK
jgi:hypothetical protein